MATVAIVGAGDIGGACAQALASRGHVSHILAIDPAAKAASGKALDIRQAGAIGGFHAQLDGTDDSSRAAGCSVCVIADRFAPGSPEWQGEDGLAMIRQFAPAFGDGPLVFAGVMQGDLIAASVREARLNRRRLIGSFGLLICARRWRNTASAGQCGIMPAASLRSISRMARPQRIPKL